MSLGRECTSARSPPKYAKTTLERFRVDQRIGSAAAERPRARARKRRKASEELPSENSPTTTRYRPSGRPKLARGAVAAEDNVPPWARGVSRTKATQAVARNPGMIAIQKTWRIDIFAAIRSVASRGPT